MPQAGTARGVDAADGAERAPEIFTRGEHAKRHAVGVAGGSAQRIRTDRWRRIMTVHPTIPVEDGQLAATALQHHLIFATDNVRHIANTGVAFVNAF
jgi:predicted nucleic acid-binding protein